MLLRALIGGALGAAVATCGVVVGIGRALMAPGAARYDQAVLGPRGGLLAGRYGLAFIAAGLLLGILWPIGRLSRGASTGVGASVGALFAALALPAMNAALPNWPLGAAPPQGPHPWAINLAAGMLVGAILGWGFPVRPRNTRATSDAPTA